MGEHGQDHKQHYIKIWGILCALLVVSIVGPEMDRFLPEGIFFWVLLTTAFGIAGVKAWLVIKHFMHLTDEPPIVWYILTSSLVFMVLFFAAVAPDVMYHEGAGWENVAAKKAVIDGLAEGEAGHGDHGDHADPADHGDDEHAHEEGGGH